MIALLFRSMVSCGLVAALGMGQQGPVRDQGRAQIATGTGVLTGVVVTADAAKRPLRRAVVTLSSTDAGLRLASVTDDQGRFAFSRLPQGRYGLSVAKPGYVTASYGAKRPGGAGTTIPLGDGERRTDLTMELMKGAVIAGMVRDGTGTPLPGVRVLVLRPIFSPRTGERTLSSAAPGFGIATDSRGTYRIYGLAPGDYYVVVTSQFGVRRSSETRETTRAEVEWAMRQMAGQFGRTTAAPTPPPPPGPAVDYAPVFYPGVFTQDAAAVVTLKAGEERTGVDTVLNLMPMASITGTVVTDDGRPLPSSLQVTVVAHDTIPGVPFSGFGSARVDAQGRFSSGGLSPGDYTITVRPAGGAGRGRGGAPSGPTLFGLAVVSVNGVDIETTVTLREGATVSGKVVLDERATAPPPNLAGVRLNLSPGSSRGPTLGVPAVTADSAGTFTFKGVTPGRYRLTATGGAWLARSAMLGGRDLLDEELEVGEDNVGGIEVQLTDRLAEVSGELVDATGRPAPDYFIILFPADKALWTPLSRRIQSVRPGGDGKYRLQRLPAGEYLLAAVTDVEPGEWFDPSFLEQLVDAATKITLADKEKKEQSFRVGR